jgi:hypothetical protein
MRNGRFGTLSVDLQAIAVAGSREFVSVHRQTLTRRGEPVHREVRKRDSPYELESRRKGTMAEGNRKNWRDLCNAALQAKDPDELLRNRSGTQQGPET